MGTLFIVDDDKTTLLCLRYWFVKKGYTVRAFEKSEALYPALQDITPDFILLDINLPGEYGYTICKHLKEYLNLHTTIYLWSAVKPPEEKISDYHADGFLLKSTCLDVLESIITSHVKKC